jgi:hypothetical protein
MVGYESLGGEEKGGDGPDGEYNKTPESNPTAISISIAE